MDIKRIILSTLSSVILAALPAGAQTFHATPLPVLPGSTQCLAFGMNGSGDVVGECTADGTFLTERAVVWHAGQARAVGMLTGGTYSYAAGINSLGAIIGASNFTGSFQPQTFVTSPAGLINVDPLGGANVNPIGIMNNGNMFGMINKSGGGRTNGWYPVEWIPDPTHPGRYKEVPLQQFIAGDPKVNYNYLAASNNVGQAVGQLSNTLFGSGAGFWNNDSTHSVVVLTDFLGGTSADVRGLNDLGQAVGDANGHAALWQADAAHTPVDLGMLPGDSSSIAYFANTAGQIVGTSTDGVTSRDFFYANGVMQDLSTLINPADGFFALGTPRAISNAGQIVVDTTVNGQPTPLFLTPIAQ